jgi:hypothetical protein
MASSSDGAVNEEIARWQCCMELGPGRGFCEAWLSQENVDEELRLVQDEESD